MATASNSDATDSDSKSLADRLATVGRVLWVAFLAFVVLYTLVPVVGLALGVVPFSAPPKMPYFAFVGLAFVGTAALVAAGVYDV